MIEQLIVLRKPRTFAELRSASRLTALEQDARFASRGDRFEIHIPKAAPYHVLPEHPRGARYGQLRFHLPDHADRELYAAAVNLFEEVYNSIAHKVLP